ncbi:hypothetical protein IGI37_003263 [Enterococcus sp. AZ194]|uniref:TetR/AcrR family transcriptional regulator n=1 Tax=Enterococcus sp. AZ194 TaxID=2774629 RepID=UPI003F21F640
MRRRKFTSTHIIDAAYKIAMQEGYSSISARGLAKVMESSTQPIYVEFENIEVLKETLIQRILSGIHREYFSQNVSLMDYISALGSFLYEKPTVYLSLLTDRMTNERIQKFLYRQYLQSIDGLDLSQQTEHLIYSHVLGALSACLNIENKLDKETWIQSIQQQVMQSYF